VVLFARLVALKVLGAHIACDMSSTPLFMFMIGHETVEGEIALGADSWFLNRRGRGMRRVGRGAKVRHLGVGPVRSS
jgi:hypothetical protein